MIDYEKLREAHQLVIKTDLSLEHTVEDDIDNQPSSFFRIKENCGKVLYEHFNLDYLIAKLQSLAKPEPKYKIGDSAWIVYDEQPTKITITDIDKSSDEMYLDDDYDWWLEEQLYPSREALIDHQLKYWNKLKAEHWIMMHPDTGNSAVSDKGSCEIIPDPDEIKCTHEHTLLSGFACVKCGWNVVKDGGADD
jgi:hypothetical protein